MIGERSFELLKTIRQMQTTTYSHTQKKSSLLSAVNVVWFLSRLFIAMFLYTGIAKLNDPEKFYATLEASQLVSPFASFLTYAVPIFELILCVLLLIPDNVRVKKTPIRKIGFIAGGGLMLLFTVYIGLMLSLYGKEKLPCSCGGFISELSWTAHIYFNLAFVGLSMWALSLYKRMIR